MINYIDCGKKLNTRNKHTLRCLNCYQKLIKVTDQFCIDCEIQLNKYKKSLRCYSCNNKYQWKIGKRISKQSVFIDILTKDFLYQKYIIEKLTGKIISQIINCNQSIIYKFLQKHHISTRSNSESHIGYKMPQKQKEKYTIMFKGSGNPNWKNGLGNFPYNIEFNDKLKLEIRTRDNFICQYCGITEKQHFRGNKQINLIVHHIDYNKQNCKETNLISICNKDNVIANGNRDYWFAYYTYIMDNYIRRNNYGITSLLQHRFC